MRAGQTQGQLKVNIETDLITDLYTEDSQCLAKEMHDFVVSSAESQVERDFDEPVSVEQYFKRRQKNIGVYWLMKSIP